MTTYANYLPVQCWESSEEGARYGDVLEGWYEIDWMSCSRHHVLKLDFPAFVYCGLTKSIATCTSIECRYQGKVIVVVVSAHLSQYCLLRYRVICPCYKVQRK